MFKFNGVLIAALLIGTSAQAAAWKSTNDKGLFVYTAKTPNADANIILVCDPDGTRAAPEEGIKPSYSLTIQKNGAFLAGNKVSLSKGKFTENFSLDGGSLFPDAPKKWNKLISELQTTGALKIKAGSTEILLNIDKAASLNCKVKEK